LLLMPTPKSEPVFDFVSGEPGVTLIADKGL
jgi:hypothetical protein